MRPIRLLALGVAASLAMAGCDISLQSLPKFSSLSGPFYTVHATFANVLNLPEEAEVRSGVATIGQVSSISVHDFAADVTLQIKTSVKLPVGTEADVQFDDPLGDEYVEMIPPAHTTGAYLTNGSRLAEDETGSAPSIADTLAALSTVLNGGGINQLHTIVSQLAATFSGNQPRIRNLLTTVERTFGSLARHRDDVDAALAALAGLSRQLNAGTPTIITGIDTLAPAVNLLASQNKQLGLLLANVDDLAVAADDVAATSSQQTIDDLHELLPVVGQLVGVDQQVGPALASLATFEALTPKIAPGNSLQVSLTATAILSGTANATDLRSLPAGHGASKAVTELLEAGLP